MPTFRTPTLKTAVDGPLFYNFERGITVLKNHGVYTQYVNPESELVAAADVAYLGGRTYTVDATEAAALTAAGYGAYLS